MPKAKNPASNRKNAGIFNLTIFILLIAGLSGCHLINQSNGINYSNETNKATGTISTPLSADFLSAQASLFYNREVIVRPSFSKTNELLGDQTTKNLPSEIKDLPSLAEFTQNTQTKWEIPVDLVFFGDIMLGRYVRTLMDRNSMDYPFENMDADYLSSADLLIANLEGPIAEKEINTSKGIAFRFKPDIAPLLKKYHFDILSLANNHTFDMGTAGYEDSVKLLKEQSINPFGNPKEITEDSIAKVEMNKHKFAFIGLEEVLNKIDDETAEVTIAKLTTEGYKVIVSPHWGIEYRHNPNERQKELAHKFIDAGAFAVIGHHPHVVQSFEIYNNRPIFYSLGNAVFDQYFSSATQEGLSLAISITEQKAEIELKPIKIEMSKMRLMNEEEKSEFLNRFAEWGSPTETTDRSEEEIKNILNGKITIYN